jgi:hypothetical protein
MTKELSDLVAKARATQVSAADREIQRISFAYGNAAFENAEITRETVRIASERLRQLHGHATQCATQRRSLTFDG